MQPYVELHACSAFSFLRGASVPESYVAHWAGLMEQQGVGPPWPLRMSMASMARCVFTVQRRNTGSKRMSARRCPAMMADTCCFASPGRGIRTFAA